MIGRKMEMQELNELYNSSKAELVAVYGRRRVGKTYLIDETFKDKITFRHAGLSPADHEKKGFLKKQLEAFYYSLLRSGMPVKKKPKSWMEAFFMLETHLDNISDGSRQLVFIDELPWMDTPRSGFMTAFENFWNGWACYHDNLMVIVCGSATSWILDELINAHGGLYGRVTYEIKLVPFTLLECEQFLEEKGVNLSRYDIVQSYMALGGIPYYLGYFRRGFSLAQDLDNLFFSEAAKLRDEFNRLFDSVFESPETMKKLVRCLQQRRNGLTRAEIIDAMGMSDGETLSKCLKALVASDFAEKYVPFGCRANDFHYKLTDPFCMYYLHFVDDASVYAENYWTENLETQAIKSWRGLAFETVCFNHIKQIKQALGISGVSTTQSAWTKRSDDAGGTQADLLISRRDNIINMCEIKYTHDEFTVDNDYYRLILRRMGMLSELIPKTTAVHSTLITTYGLKHNKYSNAFVNVITLNDLFRQ